MRNIIFIVGLPGSGKTITTYTIRDALKDKGISHEIIYMDHAYLDFIKSKYPYMYGEDIHKNIQYHYESMDNKIHEAFMLYIHQLLDKNKDKEYIVLEGRHLESMIYKLNRLLCTTAKIVNVFMDKEHPIILEGIKTVRTMEIYKEILSKTDGYEDKPTT